MYAFLEFDDGVQIVPTKWLEDVKGKECRCPFPTKSETPSLRKMLANNIPPNPLWPTYTAEILMQDDDIEYLRKKSLKYCNRGDLESSDADCRKRYCRPTSSALKDVHNIQESTPPTTIKKRISNSFPDQSYAPSPPMRYQQLEAFPCPPTPPSKRQCSENTSLTISERSTPSNIVDASPKRCSKCCQHVEKWLSQIMLQQTEIFKEIAELRNSNNMAYSETEGCGTLAPFKSVAEFESGITDFIKHKAFKSSMALRCDKLNLRRSIDRMLTFIATPAVLSHFNTTGRNNKKAIPEEIIGVIQDIILNSATLRKQLKGSSFNGILSDVLKHMSKKEKRRSSRGCNVTTSMSAANNRRDNQISDSAEDSDS